LHHALVDDFDDVGTPPPMMRLMVASATAGCRQSRMSAGDAVAHEAAQDQG
jgi:hypothetical protein